MKTICFAIATLCFSVAGAVGSFTHLGCVYYLDKSGWNYHGAYYGPGEPLATGESRFLTGTWTSDPVLPNHAICTQMTGTEDENAPLITSYVYQATRFDPMDGNNQCTTSGENVKLVSKSEKVVPRGSYSVVESDWLTDISKMQIREYVPKLDEMDKLNEIHFKKCLEIGPVNEPS